MPQVLPVQPRRAACFSCVLVLVSLSSSPLVNAQAGRPAVTFLVKSFADQVDMKQGDGRCDTASGECTLRAAIQEANANAANAYTLVLTPGTYRLARRNPAPMVPKTEKPLEPPEENSALIGDLDITGQITIVGAGPTDTIVDGDNVDQVFDIQETAVTALMGITIRGGCAGPPRLGHGCAGASWQDGGGIRNQGSLSLVNAHVRENEIISATEGAGIFNSGPSEKSRSRLSIAHSVIARNHVREASSGGGIANNWGEVTINETEIVGNSAADYGGGIQNGSRSGELRILNSLIRENEANRGGGMHSAGVATLTNVTFSGNRARFCHGAAVYNTQGTTLRSSTVTGSTFGTCGRDYEPAAVYAFGPLTLRNSIIAEQFGCAMGSGGSVASQGYNLDQSDTCTLKAASDLRNADPKLDSLSSNGGPTPTHRLSAGSPARDVIPGTGNDSPLTDQRGAPRPFASGFDVGAFEGPESSLVDPVNGQPTITQLVPDSVAYQEIREAVLSVRGTNFKGDMAVVLDGIRRADGSETSEILKTTFSSDTELLAHLEQRHTTRSGMLSVRGVDKTGESLSNLMPLYIYQTR